MYREWQARLAGAVAWNRPATGRRTSGRVLPDGCTDLIWTGDGFIVAGPDTRAHPIETEPDSSFVGLRFAPAIGPAVFGTPANLLRDDRVPLVDLWPTVTVRRLTDRLHRAATPAAQTHELEQIAADRLHRRGPDAVAATIADSIRAGSTVAASAASAGLSVRQAHRRSVAAFGYGPKTLARILRMQRAVALARAGRAFAVVAADAGYADQAHLSREVKALAGAPLSEIAGNDP